jgi:hypothetical protein
MPFNPMMLLSALGSGQSLDNVLSSLSSQGQEYARAVNLIRGKNAQQLQTIAQNMARERGIDLNAMLSSFGITPPKTAPDVPAAALENENSVKV